MKVAAIKKKAIKKTSPGKASETKKPQDIQMVSNERVLDVGS